MDEIDDILRDLQQPWKARCRSILWSDNIRDVNFVWPEFLNSAAFTTAVSDSMIKCELAFFEPCCGPKLYNPVLECEVSIASDCSGFTANSWIGFHHAVVIQRNPLRVEIGEKAAIWNIAQAERNFPLSVGHLCAGAFGGWDRAFTWLSNEKIINQPSCFAIESDFETMRIWSKGIDATILQGPISPQVPEGGKTIGIVAPIQDSTWFNICRHQVNLVFTASPPCQTWSNGGKQFGIQAENGMTFMQIIYGAKWVRPIAILVECSDTVPGHAHYAIVVKSFRFIGYVQCWSQIVPIHELTGMKRTRWLSLFVRHDVQQFDSVGSFKLADPLHKRWKDPAYEFFLPKSVVDQLKLTEDLKRVYGDPQFLPTASKASCRKGAHCDEVLKSRCIRSEDHLPTLCASHASQHEIDRKHLALKGIFAALTQNDGDFAFIDPAKFAALLGVTSDQGILFPHNVHDAFHQLGNSISVVHSVLGISVALSVLGFSKIPIMHNVHKCWESRICAHNTITLDESDFIHIVANEKVRETIYQNFLQRNKSLNPIPVRLCDKTITGDKHENVLSILQSFGIHAPEVQGIITTSNGAPVNLELEISCFEGQQIECSKGKTLLFELCFGYSQVEPTLPWTFPQQDPISEAEDDFDSKTLHEAVVRAEFLHSESEIQTDKIIRCSSNAPCNIGCHSVQTSEETDAIEDFETKSQGLQETKQWAENRISDHHQCEHIAVFPCKPSCKANFVSLEIPISLDHEQTSQWIAKVLGVCENKVVWYETTHYRQPHHQRCVIADNVHHGKSTEKLVIVHVIGEMPFVCKLPNPVVPSQVPGFEYSYEIYQNGSPIDKNRIVSVEHGDDFVVHDLAKRRRICELPSKSGIPFQQRIDILNEQKHKLGTDEFAILQRLVNESNAPIQCSDVWDWTLGIPHDLTDRIRLFCNESRPGAAFMCPILCNDHWSAFELTKCPTGTRITFCNIPDTLLRHVQHELVCRFADMWINLDCTSIVIPALNGFCGWALVHRWFRRFQIEFPSDPTAKCPTSLYATIHNSIEGEHQWGNVSSFAFKARLFCFLHFSNVCIPKQNIRFGATGNDTTRDAQMTDPSNEKDAKAFDPWLKFDPWQKGQKQCKWEDLTLPKDHPIHDSQRKRLEQIHRHQLNQNVGGVAFCTKSTVNDILAKKPKQPFALVLPASDKLHFDESLRLKILPSCEVVAEDGATGAVYKRQVAIAYQGEDIVFELPKPSYKGTLTEKSEIVLEAHSTLISRDSFTAFRDKPHDAIRIKVIEQFPSKATEHINIYSIRKIQDPNDVEKFKVQAMCKIDKSLRVSFLEASGAGDIIARDFIPKGEEIVDITVLPRFWPIDKNGKAEALRSGGSTDGFAGIIATRRGLAIRAWAAKVAQLRKVLMSQDERITNENINIVPKLVYDSTGWPSSASPNEIVHAVVHSCGTPPIPSRCFRAAGVVTWTLGFAVEPKVTRFSVSFNGITYEILLTKPSEKNKFTKGFKSSSKGNSKGSKTTKEPLQAQDDTTDRITNLETKFAAMERRQDSFETKLQHGFEGVQDQLRQVLNAVQPRASSPSRTGFTPPSKVAKSA